MIGVLKDQQYAVQRADIPVGARLYLFSDGVFEIMPKEGTRWGLDDFLPLLLEPNGGTTSEPARLFQRVHETARPGGFDDDFSLMTVTFL
jgi:sigma-B regulation protein RsbU (phosphoserine phosphatase)